LLLPCMLRIGKAKQAEVLAPDAAHRATLESVA